MFARLYKAFNVQFTGLKYISLETDTEGRCHGDTGPVVMGDAAWRRCYQSPRDKGSDLCDVFQLGGVC